MSIQVIVLSTSMGLAASVVLGQHHHSEMMLDWHLASNRIHVHAHGDPMPYGLPVSTFAGIEGWAAADVAFTSSEQDHPHLGTVVLPATVDIRAVLVASDPGVRVWHGSGGLPIGGEIPLGSPVIHFMPVWNITEGAPGLHQSMTFVFRDASGQLADSAPYTVTFTPVPGPAGALVVGSGVLLVGRRRRNSPVVHAPRQ